MLAALSESIAGDGRVADTGLKKWEETWSSLPSVEDLTDNKPARCLAIVADAHPRFACNGDQS
jgi:hypothetical protein